MSLYPTRQTPIPQEKPPHLPTLPFPCTRSTGPVGITPGHQCPQSRHEGRSPNISSVLSVSSMHNEQDLCQAEGPLTEAMPFNVLQHVLPWSPLALIREQ